jgi:hypothetical protein
MFTNVSNPLSMHEVRRLAPASLEVMQRHADKSAIAAHSATLVPMASRVLTAIQDLDRLGGKQKALLAESDEQTAQLHGLMLEWSGILVRDLASFDSEAYARNASLTFDVLQKAMSLKHFVEQEAAGLPYREELIDELTARIDSADRASKTASGARVVLQEKQREVRELSAAFNKGLISLRRTVRTTLGAKHFDFHRLRVTSRAAAEPPSSEAPDAASTGPSETETGGASGPSTTT